MGSEKINLKNGPNSWYVPIKIRDNNNNTVYTSRFFINESEMITKDNNNSSEQYKKIIINQQKIIEKMTLTIKNDKLKIQKYEQIIKSK